MSDWWEEVKVYPATGERVRYFRNAHTGAQQYEVPQSYVPRNLNSFPGELPRIEAVQKTASDDPSASSFS